MGNEFFDREDTIAAVSTPMGQAGIGIVRISGPMAYSIASEIFKPSRHRGLLKSHRLYLGTLYDPKAHLPVDQVLLSYMKAPNSYTREDVVEINSHSGYMLLSRILQLVLDHGARLARPGEFTYRAFINGRIDLSQAEAVFDIINSRSEKGLYIASGQLQGAFRDKTETLKEKALDLLSAMEVIIDFPDERDEIVNADRLIRRIKEDLTGPVDRLIDAYETRRLYIEGIKTAIVGRVNAGKSSLLNRLLDEERAIVTSIPGTTRDIIDASLNIKGIPLRLMDTAGLRKTRDEVEELGLRLTFKAMSEADLLLPVIDSSRPLTREDMDLLERCRNRKALVIINKIDLPSAFDVEDYPELFHDLPIVRTSAKTGEGFDALKNALEETLLEGNGDLTSSPIAPNLRQKEALVKAREAFDRAAEGIEAGMPMEIVAFEMRTGIDALGEITGETSGYDLFERVFSKFCLGK